MPSIGNQPTCPKRSSPDWQQELARAIREPDELCDLLRLPEPYREPARRLAKHFGLLVPRGFVRRMRVGDPQDPLLRQILPLADEARVVAGFCDDPLGEQGKWAVPGVLHKYRGRALLLTTGACAVHCRYCFRRHFPFSAVPHTPRQWEPALQTLAHDASIREVILSGGDPLMMPDSWLASWNQRLEQVKHIRRLRLHTRLPIVLPQRVTGELLDWLEASRLQPILVVHANHPAELDRDCATGLSRLVDAGLLVFNQAVLLRGVNDCADTLAELCERLIELRVLPYYLHQLDPVAGAAHFEVPEEQGTTDHGRSSCPIAGLCRAAVRTRNPW